MINVDVVIDVNLNVNPTIDNDFDDLGCTGRVDPGSGHGAFTSAKGRTPRPSGLRGQRQRWRSGSSSSQRQRICAFAIAIVCGLVASAGAETLTIGLYAPTAPFASTASRVELATKLGEHFGKALGVMANGKVFARAGDFASAVKKGEVTVALVDATYLAAAGGNFTILAGAVRNGDTNHGWL